MENFFYDERFCSDISDLMDALDIDEDKVDELEEDWTCKVELTSLEPAFFIDADWICERLDDDRLDEDGDISDKVHQLVKDNVDFTKLNELMPKLYYPTSKFATITKTDLVEYCS